jgi:hypothetical protein
VRFNDDAGAPNIQTATEADDPFDGTWAPMEPLSHFDGENPNGTWSVLASDYGLEESGTIRSFSLSIDAGDEVFPPGTFAFRGAAVPLAPMTGNTSDPPVVTNATLTVSGLVGDITDLDFSIDGTWCNSDEGAPTVGLEIAYPTDLGLFLVSPEGTSVGLVNRVPGAFGSGRNFCQVTLDDEGTDGVVQGISDMAQLWGKTVKPWTVLSAFDGENPNGVWTFRVENHGNTFRPANIRAFSVHIDAAVAPLPSGLAWSNPAPITYGAALGPVQLNAYAFTLGTFAYTPPNGTVLDAGSHTLSVTFTPSNPAYATETKTVSITVNKASPGLAWATPTPFSYGTALSATQLNATANTPGNFVYDPPAGTVLDVAIHSIGVQFTPTNPNYTTASKSVLMIVGPASSGLAWATPASIVYGTALSATQLNASAAVDGAFVYTPASGTVLDAGPHTLSVTFTPTSGNYSSATTTTSITVTPASSGLAWATPAPIVYGTPLVGTQLNATAAVAGSFVYTPPLGTVLGVGTHTLSVTFTPTSTNYAPAATTVVLVVGAAPTTLTITQTPEGSGGLAARLVGPGGPVSGQTITFTLAPATPSGLPSFLCSGVTGADGVARCTITGLQRFSLSLPGSTLRNRFVATYAGTANYGPATVAVGGPPPPRTKS